MKRNTTMAGDTGIGSKRTGDPMCCRSRTNRAPARSWTVVSWLTLAVAATIGFAGCGRSPAPAETKTVPGPAVQAPPATNAPSAFQAVAFDKRTNQKRSFLTSEDVTNLPNGHLLIIKPRLTTYGKSGSVDWVADPAECVYDETTKLVSSAKEFHAATADGRFDIRGVGFQLRMEDSHLFISNAVRTLIHRPPPTNAPAVSEAPLEVFSDQFDYETNRAVYRGHVRADDPEGRLRCDRLTARFAAPNAARGTTNETRIETIVAERNVVLEQKELQATGDQAVYRAADNTIEITGHPAWRAGVREGRGDHLLVNRTTHEMDASGHVFMKLPRESTNAPALFFSAATGAANAQAATDQPIDITADELVYLPGSAVFRGRVQAADREGKLTCGTMTVGFSDPGNQVKTILAEPDVVILNLAEGSRATADRAVYTATNNRVELTGRPRWSTRQQEGRADRLRFESLQRRFLADEAVQVKLLGGGTNQPAAFLTLLSFSTNAPVAAKGPTLIYSDHLESGSGVAVFRDRVRVEDPSGTLRCGLMTATFAGPANRIQTVVAERQVDLEQAEGQMTCGRLTVHPSDLLAEQGVEIFLLLRRAGTNLPVNVIGSTAVYAAARGLLEVAGRPVLMTPQLTSTGQVLIWNHADRSLRMRGLSRTAVKPEALNYNPSGTNGPKPWR